MLYLDFNMYMHNVRPSQELAAEGENCLIFLETAIEKLRKQKLKHSAKTRIYPVMLWSKCKQIKFVIVMNIIVVHIYTANTLYRILRHYLILLACESIDHIDYVTKLETYHISNIMYYSNNGVLTWRCWHQ